MIKLVIMYILLSVLVLNGCDYRSNKLLTEQSTTFEKELAYKQRTQNELEMKFEEFVEDIIREAIEGDIIINKQELEELKEEYEYEDEETTTA